MKQITVKVPESKYHFVLELIHQLGLDILDEIDIPEHHIEIVRNRIKTSSEEDIMEWGEARKQLTFKEDM